MGSTVEATIESRPTTVEAVVNGRTVAVEINGKPSTVTVGIDRDIRTGVAQQRYTHTQVTPAATWTVSHNLGRKPQVEVLSPGGVIVEAACVHISDNQAVITFNSAQAGQAFFD